MDTGKPSAVGVNLRLQAIVLSPISDKSTRPTVTYIFGGCEQAHIWCMGMPLFGTKPGAFLEMGPR